MSLGSSLISTIEAKRSKSSLENRPGLEEMSFADDLLEQAQHLAHREDGEPKQASLRRAVSTAYYALFHLLIDDAVNQWAIDHQRRVIGRTFGHGTMRDVGDKLA